MVSNERKHRLNRTLFFLKNRLFRASAVSFYKRLLAIERSSAQELAAVNQRKRTELLLLAFDQVPHYRRRFLAAGIKRTDLHDAETFAQLPSLTRQQVIDGFSDLRASSARPEFYSKVTTGGSTGTPLAVLTDRRVPLETAWWRVARWWGVAPSDDIAFIFRTKRTPLRALANSALWWPTKRIFLDASLLTTTSMASFARRYRAIRPAIIQGYVGAVFEFAQFLQAARLTLPPPRAVWVTSAPLPESQRAFMEEVFRAPVYDQYGSCEIGWLACECQQQHGLHIMEDLRHIEIVDDAGQPVPDGEWGRILVTDLENRVFPLIRYELGDRARRLPSQCPCGLTLPLMDKVRGRVSDAIRLPGGSSISGEYLTTIFDHQPEAIIQFQVQQHRDYSISLRCVPGHSPRAREVITSARESLQRKVGPTVPVRLELVDHIPHDRGKTRFIMSDLRPPEATSGEAQSEAGPSARTRP